MGRAPRVFITGMSATGKSTVLGRLAALGHRTIDTDTEGFIELASSGDEQEWLLNEDRLREALSIDDPRALFVAATTRNQVKFYPDFDHIVLLTTPRDVTVQRLLTRTNNPYGKRPGELEEILRYKDTVEPLLRRKATLEIDTSAPVDDVVRTLLNAVGLR